MNDYLFCPRCNQKYNVSKLRDKSKVFVCADCILRDTAKIGCKKKYKPIYDRKGMAHVVYGEVEL